MTKFKKENAKEIYVPRIYLKKIMKGKVAGFNQSVPTVLGRCCNGLKNPDMIDRGSVLEYIQTLKLIHILHNFGYS